jgi:hypothetical protein
MHELHVLEEKTPCRPWQKVVTSHSVKRQRREGESHSKVEGDIKQECTHELSGIGTQCAQGSPSYMLWQQALQMDQDEKYVERQASDHHVAQRLEVGNQHGGVLNRETNSGGRRRPKALTHSDERQNLVEHSPGE